MPIQTTKEVSSTTILSESERREILAQEDRGPQHIFEQNFFLVCLALEMARNSGEEKWEVSNSDQEEEEEEALSLCDLPLNLINKENQSSKEEVQASKTEEDFDFGSLSAKPEMCAADDVFFKGQILPSRLSVSSETGLNKTQQHSQNPSRSVSRSESMDHGSLGRFTSNSSRSSSSRSHHSSTSTSTSSTTTTRNFKPRIGNNFHTHPSPKPQIKITSTRPGGNISNRTQKSSVWDFFRLGLVRTPEIELQLQDLKVRSSVSRNNSSSSSSNSSCSIKNGTKINRSTNDGEKNSHGLKMDKQKGRGGFFGGDCKCSVSAVEAVPLNNIVIIKSCTNGTTGNNKSATATHAMKEKLQELKQKKQQGKQNMSRHRTFEWLKELSHASYPDEA